MTAKITAHIQEQRNSQPEERIFTVWTTVSGIDYQAHISHSTRENLTSREAITYAVEIERLAFQDGAKFERQQYLIH
jgi:hypothetical protein